MWSFSGLVRHDRGRARPASSVDPARDLIQHTEQVAGENQEALRQLPITVKRAHLKLNEVTCRLNCWRNLEPSKTRDVRGHLHVEVKRAHLKLNEVTCRLNCWRNLKTSKTRVIQGVAKITTPNFSIA